jgi:hypothetical protein
MKRILFLLSVSMLLSANMHGQSSDFEINEKGVLTRYRGAGGDVTVPEGVTAIGRVSFSKHVKVTAVTLPASVREIGYMAFMNCTGLTSITLPEGLTGIGQFAFASCRSLASVSIPASVKSIESYAFLNCHSLTSVIMPEGKRAIGTFAFRNCKSLTSVTIPEGVTSIRMSAFHGCKNLTGVTIPSSVYVIGKNAFKGCKAITSIHVNRSVPADVFPAVFKEVRQASLHVPAGAGEHYRAAKGWNNFRETVEDLNPVAGLTAGDTIRLENPCTVSVTRSVNFVGAAGNMRVFLNGREQGILRNGQTVVMQTGVVRNELNIHFRDQGPFSSIEFDAEPGGNVDIKFSYILGRLAIGDSEAEEETQN